MSDRTHQKALSDDEALEYRIVNARMCLQFGSVGQRKAAWDELSALIKMRSAERVRVMERERGLA